MKNNFTKSKVHQQFSKWTMGSLFIFLIFMGMQGAKAQYTSIPDANFEQALIDQGYDTAPINGMVLTANINTVTTLLVPQKSIADLTGIQAFSALTILDCYGNNLTTLNVSGLTALTDLNCQVNQLTSLDLTGLTALTDLHCSFNQLTSLNVSGLTALTDLHCMGGQLTSLDASGLTALTTLSCQSNQLTSLNVSGATALKNLNCYNNQLTSLNVSGLSALDDFGCFNNQLTSIDLTGLSAVTYFDCSNNQLTSLNMSSLTAITESYVNNNNLLTSVNLNGLPASAWLDFTSNPALTCIQVDDVAVATANSHWTKDTTANYSINCNLVIPTSKIKNNLCGATLTSLNQNINADYIAGYQQYRFEVTNGTTVNTIEVNKYNFSLTQTPGIAYGTTYGVRVAVKMGGSWGAYGVSCDVTTPALNSNTVLPTKLLPDFCGTTLAELNTKIGAMPVYVAAETISSYRFEITTGGVTTIFDSPTYNFRLAQAGVAAYGTTYTIRVAAQVNGIYGNYGASCTVSTPAAISNNVPTTNIIPSLCGTTLASKDAKITAVMITGATNGRYEITKAGSAPVVYEVASTVIKLSQTGVVVDYNTAYTIRVAAFIGGVWGNYGTPCTVTTPAAPSGKLKTKLFEVTAYPNPFDSAFNLSIDTPSKEAVTIAVYDMMGKLVETHQVNPTEVANLQIGNNFAAGIYNVIVSQANEMQAIRLIRK